MKPEELVVYADGSYYSELRLGGWAFRVPEAQLAGAGVGEGDSNLHFELMAVVCGLEDTVRADGNSGAIRVVSDCQYVLAWISEGNRRAEGRVSGKQVPDGDADLLRRLFEIAKLRRLAIMPFKRGNVEHLTCHREAARLLQQEVAANPLLTARLALCRQKLRMAELLRQHDDVSRRLLQIEEKRLLQRTKIEALEHRIVQLTGAAVCDGLCTALPSAPPSETAAAS
jgi:ribonuclease HI